MSVGWDDPDDPALVTVVVTRPLPNGNLAVAAAIVDRTCLGIKDAFVLEPTSPGLLPQALESFGAAHGGMVKCEPLVAQSVVFHALDFSRALGFTPHEDFEETLFGPRPDVLLETPWWKVERPIYFAGPYDNLHVNLARLKHVVGADGFDFFHPDLLEDELEDDWDDEGELVHSPLERTVERDGVSLRICIYRGEDSPEWILEVYEPRGGSTIWNDRFASDQEALEVALSSIEEEGVAPFVTFESDS